MKAFSSKWKEKATEYMFMILAATEAALAGINSTTTTNYVSKQQSVTVTTTANIAISSFLLVG